MKRLPKPTLVVGLWLVFLPIFGQIPAGYYNSAEGKNTAALKTALSNIVKTHASISYSAIWNAFTVTDLRPDGYLWDIYTTCSFAPGEGHCSISQNMCVCINREHSFPKSWFGGEVSPMYTDLFHIYPADSRVNNQHSNLPFGECANGVSEGPETTAKKGASTFSGYTGTVFEPNDESKGDLARSYFYMVTCYEDKLPYWPGSPQLVLNTYPSLSDWSINLLLKWTRQDPVSQKEIDRNNAIYQNYQQNRNPFIDHSELAEYIWGNKMSEFWHENNSGINDATIVFALSPNPVKDIIKVSNDENVDYSIYSILGKKLKNGTIIPNGTISVSNLTNGVYLIYFTKGKQKQIEKFIVNR